MAQSTQCFTQSLRFLDPVNQYRIKSSKRILWPDYETLKLLNDFSQHAESSTGNVNLSNLFLYCPFEENFLVKKTTTNQYLNLKQLYSDEYTHLSLWVCRNQYSTSNAESPQNSRALQNKRQKSLQKGYKIREKTPSYRDMYVILSKRPLAIDQIVKTSHKVCISVAPLSSQKFLWGGALHYEQFESLEHQKKEQGGLFRTGGESFGFKIESKKSFGAISYRKSNGLIDKRQQRYSNYFKSQKQQQRSQLNKVDNNKPLKQSCNRLNILPQHIRQYQQFLYIQIDLDNNIHLPTLSEEYKFISLDIYARHLKPTYGGIYQRQSSSSDSEDEYNELKGALNKYKRLLKQEIFLVYSMPFMEFNSYVESQLNFEENQQLREINFRGSCFMFSAMKKLELKSSDGKEENKKEGNQKEKGKKRRFMKIEQEKKEDETIIQRSFTNKELSQQLVEKGKVIECRQQRKQAIQIVVPNPFISSKKQDIPTSRDLLRIQRIKILTQLYNKFNKNQDNLSCEQQRQEIYIPVFNPEGFEPLRIAVERQLMQYLNPFIGKLVAKVFVDVSQIRRCQQQRQQSAGDNKGKRRSVYVGKKRGQPIEKQQDLIGIDVFLTDKVYKQQTVQMLIDLMRQLQGMAMAAIDKPPKNQQTFFISLKQLDQLRNLLILLVDIQNESVKQQKHNIPNICDEVRLLIWLQMLMRLDDYNQSKLKLIRQIQEQTGKLLVREDSFKYDRQENNLYKREKERSHLEDQQQQIIDLIKDYHYTYTRDKNDFYINLFFFFLALQHIDSSSCKVIQYFRTYNGNHHQNGLIQNILSDFFLVNCKSILDEHQLQLSAIINKLSKSKSQLPLNKQSTRLICMVLKQAVTYVIGNLSSMPVDVFLTQPLEQFEEQVKSQHIINQPHLQDIQFTPSQLKSIFTSQKLKRFLKKYFIRGHNFLERQASRNLIDADNSYMSIITDLLNVFIKLTNIERSLMNNDNDNGLLLVKEKHLWNIIQLINDQYSRCLNTNGSIVFENMMIINDNNSLRTVQMNRFDRNQQLDHSTTIKSLQSKYEQIIKNQTQWKINQMSFLVHQRQQNITQTLGYLTISNQHRPILLTNNRSELSGHYIIINFSHKVIQTVLDFQSCISFIPTDIEGKSITLSSTNNNTSSSQLYSIDLVRSHMALSYNHYQQDSIFDNNKSFFSCFEVFVEVEITTNKSGVNNNNNDVNIYMLRGSNVLMFEKFNYTGVNKNQIFLHRCCGDESIETVSLGSIRQVKVKIYSKQLPILQASLLFINFRLGKYLKHLLNKQNLPITRSTSKSSRRKTIGGRFTEYLNNRKSVHAIEGNVFFGQSRKQSTTCNEGSTLFELPQALLFDVLRADKSYIQDQEKILYFIDAFYQKNQPQFSDYILYLCVRPNFLRSSSMLKHYFANKLKYEESKILSLLIKKRLSTCVSNIGNQSISQLVIGKPRISSAKPLANVRDTVEQRELLNKYMKDITRKHSLLKNEHSQQVERSPLFSKKPIFQIRQQQSKSDPKDIEI